VCIWKITAPVGHVVRIHFNDFDLQSSSSCTADYTEIRDGQDGTGKQLAKYCGSYRGSVYDFYSSGRYMWVKFRSDLSESEKGFSGVYTTAVENQGKYKLLILKF
jgi:cubilin